MTSEDDETVGGADRADPPPMVRRRSSRRRSSPYDHSVRLDPPSTVGRRRRRSALVGSGRRPRRATSTAERTAIWAIAVLAGLGAAPSGAEPTGTFGIDPLLTAVAVAGVALAASRAQRWTWLVLTGVATAVALWPWQVVAAAGLLVAFSSTIAPRARWIGALAVGLGCQGLLRTDIDAFHGASLLVGLAVVVPVLVSAWEVAPGSSRRLAVRVGMAAAGVVVVGTALAGVSVLVARGDLEEGADAAAAGLDDLADSRTAESRDELEAAADAFASGRAAADSWWAAPARVVPVVSQQVRAVAELAAAGEAITREAAATAGTADPQDLRYEDGAIDLSLVRAAEAPLADTVAALEEASSRIDAIRSPWLLGPVAERVEQLDADVAAALPSARLASQAVAELPGLLGEDGTRRYLVLFTTPAESRGLGGFVGNWAVLEATDGAVDLVDSGRISELNERPGRDERRVTAPPDYLARYGRFRPAYWLQDTTFSPDFPTVAQVWRELWPQVSGEELDGVIEVDPYGLAALLELTGPIRVEGWPEPLTSDNAAEVLLAEQYVRVDDRDARADLLDEASRVAFEELTSGTLPSARELSRALSPAVTSGRIRAWTFDRDEQALVERAGVDGTFPRSDGSDLLAVVTQNSGQNKIDVFLRREVDYDVVFDPATGAVDGTATVTLTNDAPSEGLPDAVIGSNDQGLPPGTNRVWVSVYSPLGLEEARLDGRRVGVEYGREFPADGPGYAVYGGVYTIPPGASVTLELDLRGTIDPGAYRLRLPHQPLVNADEVSLRVALTPGWSFAPSDVVGISRDRRTASLDVVAFDAGRSVVLDVTR